MALECQCHTQTVPPLQLFPSTSLFRTRPRQVEKDCTGDYVIHYYLKFVLDMTRCLDKSVNNKETAKKSINVSVTASLGRQ